MQNNSPLKQPNNNTFFNYAKIKLHYKSKDRHTQTQQILTLIAYVQVYLLKTILMTFHPPN